jgi:S1-C subfamily serine protease
LVLLLMVGSALGYWYWHERAAENAHPPVIEAKPRPVTARGDLQPDEALAIDIYREASPSVVHVTNIAVHTDFFSLNQEKVAKGTGTGFVWNEDGIIVTNYHVVQEADTMRVILADKNRTTYDTRVWVSYPDKDLAALWIKAPKEKLRPLRLGTSHDLQIGQKTFAIGNPFGLDQTLTTGIVSALGREIESATGRPISGVIQTSAAINPGNSGGPLLDSSGRLIGVNTAILSPSGTFAGIGFAIPVDEVNLVVPQLIAALNEELPGQHHEVKAPRLGVELVPEQTARQLDVSEGVLIKSVQPGGPAAEAGLRPTRVDRSGHVRLGDIIIGIDKQPVKNVKDLYKLLERHKIGDEITITIIRDEQQEDVKVTLQALQL